MRFGAKSQLKAHQLTVLTLAFFGLIAWLVSTTTQAASPIVVTTTADNGNNASPVPGSLREAIITSNNTAGTDTIAFNIGTGAQTIMPTSSLPVITDPVIIDGTTQPGFAGTPVIELKGTNAGSSSVGLQINAGSTTVRGLVINRFDTGIFLTSKGNNLIVGNYIGTNLAGTAAQANTSHGINAQGGNGNTIGGTTAADRNIISGNSNMGIRLSGSSSTIVLGNYIGTDITGTVNIGNGNQGLRMENSGNNKIGGTAAGEGNIISGSGDAGVLMVSAFGNTVAGNRIGTDGAGTGSIGNGDGGVVVLSGTNNSISANSIAFNTGLGIDLDVDGSFPLDGITPNDTNDGDAGSNDLQNFPVITAVNRQAGSTQIQGTLNSTANTQFRLEFFANFQCDPSGAGEGQTYLGTANVTTVGNDAAFDVTLPVAVPATQSVTVTATNPTGNTSEFSQCAGGSAPVLPSLSISDVSKAEGNSGTTDFVFSVTLSQSSNQTVTVNYATTGGTAQTGVDFQAKSGPLTFNPGDLKKTFTVLVNGDTTVEPDEIFSIFLTSPVNATIADNQGDGTILNDDVAPVSTVQFEQATYSVAEDAHFKLINVTRTGDTTQTATVDYATTDGTAAQRTDYNLLLGTLSFAPGETSKTLTLLITEDSYVEGSETLSLNLSNATGVTLGAQSQAQVTITDNDQDQNAPNAITDKPNFVRQQYHDFLNREPDPPGFQGWQAILNNCPQSGKDSNGNFCDRVEVSSAFFRSQEFHDRGYFIYRFYEAALGRIPKYQEFMKDMQKVSGFLNDQQQEQAKVSFIAEFMARNEFKQKYDPVVDAAAYVDALSTTAGVTLSNRNQIVQQLQGSQITRGQALRMVVESAEVDQKFYDEAFVIMQYFGYLRRDADALYLQWIQTLKLTKDYRVLVNGFLNSTEYVLRFGK